MTEQLNYKPQDIANWFLNQIDPQAGDSITHLKLQKLVYYAEAWSLALLDKSLFCEDFEAWAYGPVVRSVFDQFKDYRWNPITTSDEPPDLDEETEEILKEVYRVYGEHSAKTLQNLTHREDPWINARTGYEPEERCNEKISKQEMKNYYSWLYEQAKNTNSQ